MSREESEQKSRSRASKIRASLYLEIRHSHHARAVLLARPHVPGFARERARPRARPTRGVQRVARSRPRGDHARGLVRERQGQGWSRHDLGGAAGDIAEAPTRRERRVRDLVAAQESQRVPQRDALEGGDGGDQQEEPRQGERAVEGGVQWAEGMDIHPRHGDDVSNRVLESLILRNQLDTSIFVTLRWYCATDIRFFELLNSLDERKNICEIIYSCHHCENENRCTWAAHT